MPDIQLRFQKDMLVLSAPLDAMLARQGVNAARDREYLNLMEPDSITDILRLEVAAGAQCIVTATEDITQARLAHVRMDADAPQLARAALAAAQEAKPQHILAEIGPCELPLDAASKASLKENRDQYANAARAFMGGEAGASGEFDAFFLNGFTKVTDLKCALMGLALVSDKPIFASVTLGDLPVEHASEVTADETGEVVESDTTTNKLPDFPFDGYSLLDKPSAPPLPSSKRVGLDPAAWPEALEVMVDFGVSVAGFETAEPIDQALAFAKTAVEQTNLPILVQLHISPGTETSTVKNLTPLEDINEYTPDTMATVAVKLYGAGVQFLRATGAATPVYTGALAATVTGHDVYMAPNK